MPRKTPPFKNWEKWTEARFWSFIRSALRRAWMKYPPKYEALKQAEVGRKVNKKTGKLAKHYKCNICKKEFVANDVQVDHIVEAGTLRSYEDLPEFVNKLFCSADDLQVLCKPCHKNK